MVSVTSSRWARLPSRVSSRCRNRNRNNSRTSLRWTNDTCDNHLGLRRCRNRSLNAITNVAGRHNRWDSSVPRLEITSTPRRELIQAQYTLSTTFSTISARYIAACLIDEFERSGSTACVAETGVRANGDECCCVGAGLEAFWCGEGCFYRTGGKRWCRSC